jgi:nucleoside 2-deoxyribosyltransferase
MKIYFAGAIRGGRDDAKLYLDIIKHLQQFGEVLTEHVADKDLTADGEKKDESYIHDRDMAWLCEADVVVAEVTVPSLGVGYEIRAALEMGKPVLCLFRPGERRSLSAMVRGSKDAVCEDYSDLEQAKSITSRFLAKG